MLCPPNRLNLIKTVHLLCLVISDSDSDDVFGAKIGDLDFGLDTYIPEEPDVATTTQTTNVVS